MNRIVHLLPILLILLTLFSGAFSSAAADTVTRIYWTEWRSYNPDLSRIARANADGSNQETVLDGFQEGVGLKDLALDSEGGIIYFANRSAGLIECVNLDGSGRDTLLTDVHPIGMAVDVTGGKIYWADYTYNDPVIQRADLDGSNVQTIYSANDGCQFEGLVLDVAAGYVYWSERMDQQIWRANMGGGGAVMLLQCWEGIGHPWGLALWGGRIYWASDYAIYSATVGGDDIQPLVEGLPDIPRSLEMDPTTSRLYWVTGSSYSGVVQRINMDGSGLETLISGLNYGYGLALEFGEPVAVPDTPESVVQLESYPNPFNPATVISFDTSRAQSVTLQVHTLDGALLDVLLDERLEAGHHTVRWNGHDREGRALPSGVYFCRLITEQGNHAHRMTLVR